LLKTHRSPFESLGANGAGLEMIEHFPFVRGSSKHSEASFSNLLGRLPSNSRPVAFFRFHPTASPLLEEERDASSDTPVADFPAGLSPDERRMFD
jgi:hypothetical protein